MSSGVTPRSSWCCLQQAARISDRMAFFLNGHMVEYDLTDTIFHQTAAGKDGRLYHWPIRLRKAEKNGTFDYQTGIYQGIGKGTRRVFLMGMAATRAVSRSMKALLELDQAMAAEVVAGDDQIDDMIIDIEDRPASFAHCQAAAYRP